MNVLTTAASGSILFDSGTAGGSTHTDLSAAVELSYDGAGGNSGPDPFTKDVTSGSVAAAAAPKAELVSEEIPF